MRYRRLLRKRGLGKISFSTINIVYAQKNYNKLYVLLQEIFLEYINKVQFDYILKELSNTSDGLRKLYNRHQQDKELRILSIVKTL